MLKFLMFNRFTKMYLNSNYFFLQWNKRIKSTILELWYNLAIFFPFLVILMIPTIILGDPKQVNFSWTDLLSLIPFCLFMVALVNKDIFGSQSPVHRLLGYQVIDIKTNRPASKMKCMLRNITVPLWPIEFFFLLASPKRRLGDYIAGTGLIDVHTSDPELILNEIKNSKFDSDTKLTVGISFIWAILYVFVFYPGIIRW